MSVLSIKEFINKVSTIKLTFDELVEYLHKLKESPVIIGKINTLKELNVLSTLSLFVRFQLNDTHLSVELIQKTVIQDEIIQAFSHALDDTLTNEHERFLEALKACLNSLITSTQDLFDYLHLLFSKTEFNYFVGVLKINPANIVLTLPKYTKGEPVPDSQACWFNLKYVTRDSYYTLSIEVRFEKVYPVNKNSKLSVFKPASKDYAPEYQVRIPHVFGIRDFLRSGEQIVPLDTTNTTDTYHRIPERLANRVYF